MTRALNNAPLAQLDPYFKESPDQDSEEDLTEVDPDQLLTECKEVLQRRPARPHRDLVQPRGTVPHSHKHNPTIRVMQWNILAQGTDVKTVLLSSVLSDCFLTMNVCVCGGGVHKNVCKSLNCIKGTVV